MSTISFRALTHRFALAVILLACSLPRTAPTTAATIPVWPIRVNAGGRYLEDSAGQPFLYFAQVTWMIGVHLSQANIRSVLDEKQAAGVNAIHVLMTPWRADPVVGGWRSTGMNVDGERPFADDNNFATFNPAYFDNFTYVIEQARLRGMLVMLAPMYPGCCGEAWIDQIRANDVNNIRAYGRFLGQTFGAQPNIAWIMGGDRDAYTFQIDDRPRYDALVAGLRESDTTHWITFHSGAATSARAVASPWRTVDGIYTYAPGRNGPYHTYVNTLEAYGASPAQPGLLLESNFEGDLYSSLPVLRRQAWWAMTSGAAGHAYGDPFWNYWPYSGWDQNLLQPGFEQVRLIKPLLESIAWWKLAPDQSHTFLTAGYGQFQSSTSDANSGSDYATASIAADGSVALVYVPPTANGARQLTLDLRRIAGGAAHLTWFDPVNGARADGGSPATSQVLQLSTPGNNAEGNNDWVLLVEATGAGATATPVATATPNGGNIGVITVRVTNSQYLPLVSWMITARRSDSSIAGSGLTGPDGRITLSLPSAHYTVCETVQPGYALTFPGNVCYWVTVNPSAAFSLNFLNDGGAVSTATPAVVPTATAAPTAAPTATPSGSGINLTINLAQDSFDPLSGWTVRAENRGTGAITERISATDGQVHFQLDPGNYKVCVVIQSGWISRFSADGCIWQTYGGSPTVSSWLLFGH